MVTVSKTRWKWLSAAWDTTEIIPCSHRERGSRLQPRRSAMASDNAQAGRGSKGEAAATGK